MVPLISTLLRSCVCGAFGPRPLLPEGQLTCSMWAQRSFCRGREHEGGSGVDHVLPLAAWAAAFSAGHAAQSSAEKVVGGTATGQHVLSPTTVRGPTECVDGCCKRPYLLLFGAQAFSGRHQVSQAPSSSQSSWVKRSCLATGVVDGLLACPYHHPKSYFAAAASHLWMAMQCGAG